MGTRKLIWCKLSLNAKKDLKYTNILIFNSEGEMSCAPHPAFLTSHPASPLVGGQIVCAHNWDAKQLDSREEEQHVEQ